MMKRFHLLVFLVFMAYQLFPDQVLCESGNEFHFKQGNAWFKKGDYNRAVADYTKAIELKPNNFQAFNNRGIARFHKGEHDLAIADFTRAIGINPRYAEAYNNRGTALFYKGFYYMAIAEFTKAVSLNPQYSEAFYNRGKARFRTGDYYWAILDYSTASNINPQYADAYTYLSWTLAACPDGRFRNGTKALELAQKAIALNPNHFSLDALAAAYAETGKFKEATATQQKAINAVKAEGKNEELPMYTKRLDSYKARKPWRDHPIVTETNRENLPRTATIGTATANIRTKPDLNSPIADKLKEGDKVILIDRKDEWYVMKFQDGRLGWAHQSLFFDSD